MADEWVVILDEDAFFRDLSAPLSKYLRHLDSRPDSGVPLKKLFSQTEAGSHRAQQERCVVAARDTFGYAGINAGTRMNSWYRLPP